MIEVLRQKCDRRGCDLPAARVLKDDGGAFKVEPAVRRHNHGGAHVPVYDLEELNRKVEALQKASSRG